MHYLQWRGIDALHQAVVCPWCIEAVAWLEEAFDTIDVLCDSIAYEACVDSKRSLTPTLETSDGAVLPDFDVAQLENFMLKNRLAP